MFQPKLGHLQVRNHNFKVGYEPEVDLIYVKTCCTIRQTVLSNKGTVVLRLIFMPVFYHL